MTYFTSWDINVFLCLICAGIPDDVIKRMLKVIKKTHEDFSLDEARKYWVKNSPTLVRIDDPSRLKRLKFYVPNDNDRGRTRIGAWQKRRNNTIEFKTEWRLRSIDLRQAKVVEWCKFGDAREQLRHQDRLRIFKKEAIVDRNYTKNLWRTWEAGASSYYFVCQNRRNYISKWYEGIHPGRFFLFYRKNKIIEERNRSSKRTMLRWSACNFPKTPIFDLGPYEQLIEDLRCIDGPGLGESGGSKVEHIDDIFLK